MYSGAKDLNKHQWQAHQVVKTLCANQEIETLKHNKQYYTNTTTVLPSCG